MDLNIIIDSIYEVQTEEDKLELLEDILEQIKEDVIVNQLRRFFLLISHLF